MDTVFDFESKAFKIVSLALILIISCSSLSFAVQSELIVSDGIYQIDYNKDIIFVPNDTEQSIFKRNLMTNADSIMVFTDSRLSTVNTGYLNDGNVAVFEKNGYTKPYTVYVNRLTAVYEDFESRPIGDYVRNSMLFPWNNEGPDRSVSVVEQDGNKAVNIKVRYAGVGGTDAFIQSGTMCLLNDMALSFEACNSASDMGFLSVVLRTASSQNINLINIGSTVSYLGISSGDTADEGLERFSVKITPSTGRVTVYSNGELKASASYDDFDFENCYVRFQTFVRSQSGYQADVLLDNIEFYENRSLSSDFFIQRARLYKTGAQVGGLHLGEISVGLPVDNITNQTKEMSMVVARYSNGRLQDVRISRDAALAPDMRREFSETIYLDDIDDKSRIKVYAFGDLQNLKPYCKTTLFLSDIAERPFPDEIQMQFAKHTNNNNIHPRILAANDDFRRIDALRGTDPVMAGWYGDLTAAADRILAHSIDDMTIYNTPEKSYYIRYEKSDGIRLLPMSQKVLQFVEILGMAYRLTNEPQYANRVWEILQRAGIDCPDKTKQFPDWNPPHFLDVGEMTAAFAIGYDWCFNYFDDDQREYIEQSIIQFGLNPGLNAYQNNEWWLKTKSNWNPTCNGGLMMGALAIIDKYPQVCAEIVSKAIENISYSIKACYPDGDWYEGPTYGMATVKSIALSIDTLKTSLGKAYGLTTLQGFDNISDYFIAVDGPVSIHNYGDSGETHLKDSAMLWLAKTFNNNNIATQFMNRVSEGTPRAMLWYEPRFTSGLLTDLNRDSYFGGGELVTMRNEWNNDKSLWLSLFGGTTTSSQHSHLDCGSFVLDWNGYRWANDLGADNYNLPGYQFNAYRTRAEGHNTLVINPDGGNDQETYHNTPVTEMNLNCDTPYAITDLTDAYKSKAASVRRGFMLDDNRRSIVIRDEIDLKTDNSDIYWFMHTKAVFDQVEGFGGGFDEAITLDDAGNIVQGRQNYETVPGECLKSIHDKSLRLYSNGGSYERDGDLFVYKDISGQQASPDGYSHLSFEYLAENLMSGTTIQIGVNYKQNHAAGSGYTDNLAFDIKNGKMSIFGVSYGSSTYPAYRPMQWNKIDLFFKGGDNLVYVYVNGELLNSGGTAWNSSGKLFDTLCGLRIEHNLYSANNEYYKSAIQFDNINVENVSALPASVNYTYKGETLSFDDGITSQSIADGRYNVTDTEGNLVRRFQWTGKPAVRFWNPEYNAFESGVFGKPAWDQSLHGVYSSFNQGLQYNTGVTLNPGDVGKFTVMFANRTNYGTRVEARSSSFSGKTVDNTFIIEIPNNYENIRFFGVDSGVPWERFRWYRFDLVFKVGDGISTYTTVDCYIDGNKVLSDVIWKPADSSYDALSYIGDLHWLTNANRNYYLDDLAFYKIENEFLDNQIILAQGDSRIKLEFLTDADQSELSVVPAVPFDTSPAVPGQNKNKDFKKIQIHLRGSGRVNLAVKITPLDNGEYSSISDIPLEEWRDIE